MKYIALLLSSVVRKRRNKDAKELFLKSLFAQKKRATTNLLEIVLEWIFQNTSTFQCDPCPT